MELESWFEILFMAAADTGVVGEVGRGAAGKAFQKEGSGGKEYEGRTGISGTFSCWGREPEQSGKKQKPWGSTISLLHPRQILCRAGPVHFLNVTLYEKL
jgi:hypothetical protein